MNRTIDGFVKKHSKKPTGYVLMHTKEGWFPEIYKSLETTEKQREMYINVYSAHYPAKGFTITETFDEFTKEGIQHVG